MLTRYTTFSPGMQHNVITASAPYGLGLDQVLLPEVLRSAGFSTHLVGKWHLGYFQSNYTPTARGFDTHYGYWNGEEVGLNAIKSYCQSVCPGYFQSNYTPTARGFDTHYGYWNDEEVRLIAIKSYCLSVCWPAM